MMLYSKTFIKSHAKEILIIILMITASLPTISWMTDRWFAANSYYSHGILVPFVTFFLIYKKRYTLKELPIESSPWGISLFIYGIILYWLGAILHVYFSSGFSMLLITAGIILHFYGEKIFKVLLFPLLFLIFMIPLPLLVVASICFKLKIIAAQLATYILNIIGLQAVQYSSIIEMRHCDVLVEDSCGGLRSLISLTALASIFAYQLKANLPRKILLFLSAFPIATFTNACRIVFLASISEIFGTNYIQGTLHNISGYMVFAFAFFILYAIKKLIEKK